MPFQKDTRSTYQPCYQDHDDKSPVRIYQVDPRYPHNAAQQSAYPDRMGADFPEKLMSSAKINATQAPNSKEMNQNGNIILYI